MFPSETNVIPLGNQGNPPRREAKSPLETTRFPSETDVIPLGNQGIPLWKPLFLVENRYVFSAKLA
jgi:hypothetical protein